MGSDFNLTSESRLSGTMFFRPRGSLSPECGNLRVDPTGTHHPCGRGLVPPRTSNVRTRPGILVLLCVPETPVLFLLKYRGGVLRRTKPRSGPSFSPLDETPSATRTSTTSPLTPSTVPLLMTTPRRQPPRRHPLDNNPSTTLPSKTPPLTVPPRRQPPRRRHSLDDTPLDDTPFDDTCVTTTLPTVAPSPRGSLIYKFGVGDRTDRINLRFWTGEENLRSLTVVWVREEMGTRKRLPVSTDVSSLLQ